MKRKRKKSEDIEEKNLNDIEKKDVKIEGEKKDETSKNEKRGDRGRRRTQRKKRRS